MTDFPVVRDDGSAAPSRPESNPKFLNQIQLSRRWGLSPRTLERWRWSRKGPPYIRIGGAVRYALDSVQAYEAAQLRVTDSDQKEGR